MAAVVASLVTPSGFVAVVEEGEGAKSSAVEAPFSIPVLDLKGSSGIPFRVGEGEGERRVPILIACE